MKPLFAFSGGFKGTVVDPSNGHSNQLLSVYDFALLVSVVDPSNGHSNCVGAVSGCPTEFK